MTITIGIDPHKATHTAVAVDPTEAVIGAHKVRAAATQATALLDWAQGFGSRTWAVESSAGLGYLLGQQLVAAGETVVDVPPVLAARVRIMGSGRSQKTHCTRLHALLGELHPGGIASEMTVTKANALLSEVEAVDEVTRCRLLIATELIEDIARLDASLKASKKRVKVAVLASGTTLTDIYGIGPICAAMIIGHVRDVGRFPTKGHFATYNATAPIEASSGGHSRHRLNPRGNRKVNHALHVAAVCQLRYDGEGRTYYDRKIAEGKSSKEAIRALKRRISDRVYSHLVADARRANDGLITLE